MFRLIHLGLIAVFATVVAAPASAQNALEDIKKRGTLIVGVKADYKPYGFRDPSGAIVGIEPDLAADVAKRLGVKLAIDDFGTGFSSLVNLRNFPADYLKLDGTFIRDIGSQGGDDPIVRSVIQLAHSLNMSVVAEWVTTDDQSQRLKLLGCDFVQGNKIGEPVTSEKFYPLATSTNHSL